MSVDDEAYEYYANPENRVPAGPGRRRTTKSTHVPIRFTPEMIADVKQLAEGDRKTVSTWVRDVVGAEVERRRPRWPRSVGFGGQNTTWPPESSYSVGPIQEEHPNALNR